MARAAEEAGFDSIWLGDHLLYRGDGRPERGPWEAGTMLAALAAATSRVELGPLVACTAFHPPGLIAKMAAAIDEISGGRLVLGLGAGWNEPEFRAFGLPYDHRVSRFEEAFAIVRGMLAGERVTLHGRYWDVQDAVLLPEPHRRGALMIGSNGPRVLSLALPHADSWNTRWGGDGDGPGVAQHRPPARGQRNPWGGGLGNRGGGLRGAKRGDQRGGGRRGPRPGGDRAQRLGAGGAEPRKRAPRRRGRPADRGNAGAG